MALYLVSTPIGNLDDITVRALGVLRGVDLIAAEDTRKTRQLLQRHDIQARLKSYFEHNEERSSQELLKELLGGREVALVTNAGTPTVSDPGYVLVRSALDAGVEVVSIPGATALIAALTVSGLPVNEFLFRGFPPRKSGKRQNWLAEVRDLACTLIFYESPHRVRQFLADALQALGNRRCAVCRELTKRFEQVRRGHLAEAVAYFEETPPRGEFVVVIEGRPKRPSSQEASPRL